MISEKVWQAITRYGSASQVEGDQEIRKAKLLLITEIEIHVNQEVINALERTFGEILAKAETQTGKGR